MEEERRNWSMHSVTWRARLHKYVLYETRTRLYFIGSDRTNTKFSVLKVDRTSQDLSIHDDPVTYSMPELKQLLNTLNYGNQWCGGLKKLCVAYGCLGFIRFTQGYYMVLVTKKKYVGNLGHHSIHCVSETLLIPIAEPPPPSDPEEEKYKALFHVIDMTNFYFSYTYDLSHTLQYNMTSPSYFQSPTPSSSSSSQATPRNHPPSTPNTRRSLRQRSLPHSANKEGGSVTPRGMRVVVGSRNSGNLKTPRGRNRMDSVRLPGHTLPQSPVALAAGYAATTSVGGGGGGSGGGRQSCHPRTFVPLGEYSPMFVWNDFLFKELARGTDPPVPKGAKCHIFGSKWIIPLIHGYFQQSTIEISGRTFLVSLIARRSRYFAGARFLRRGVNDQGYVANDVETEQIIEERSRTTVADFGHFTSFVQVRGSIPLYWGQDGSIMAPKPPIFVSKMDPFYTSTFLHFQDMFRRFGHPLIVLNLVKSTERKRREGILRQEFSDAMLQINATLPPEYKIIYVPWDFHKASKDKDQDVIAVMNTIASQALRLTGFFHSGRKLPANAKRDHLYPDEGGIRYCESAVGRYQSGVVRSNCIDSLDRTNAAQYVTGKVAYGWQLYALGVITSPELDFDDEVVSILVDMYQGMGNKLAVQYGGSNLAHTISTYRNKNLISKSRDLFTTITRFYSNTFSDKQKQESIDLHLGNLIPHDKKAKESHGSEWESEMESDQANQIRKRSAMDGILLLNTKWWLKPIRSFQNRIRDAFPRFPFAIEDESKESTSNLYFSTIHRTHIMTLFDKIFGNKWQNPFAPKISRIFDFDHCDPLKPSLSRELSRPLENPLLTFSPDGNAMGFDSSAGGEEEEDDEEDRVGAKSERMLSWGVKKWLTLHYTPSKAKDLELESQANRIPRGMELMDPFDAPIYDHICDVYARDQYGIRENDVSKRNRDVYEGYVSSWGHLESDQLFESFIVDDVDEANLEKYEESVHMAEQLTLISEETLSSTYQDMTNFCRSYIQNGRKLVSGKGTVTRESEVIYVKYCKEYKSHIAER